VSVRLDDPVLDLVQYPRLQRGLDRSERAPEVLRMNVALIGLERAGKRAGGQSVNDLEIRGPRDALRGDVIVPGPHPSRLERHQEPFALPLGLAGAGLRADPGA